MNTKFPCIQTAIMVINSDRENGHDIPVRVLITRALKYRSQIKIYKSIRKSTGACQGSHLTWSCYGPEKKNILNTTWSELDWFLLWRTLDKDALCRHPLQPLSILPHVAWRALSCHTFLILVRGLACPSRPRPCIYCELYFSAQPPSCLTLACPFSHSWPSLRLSLFFLILALL